MLRMLAVTLPDHVNAACLAAQDELFRRYGLISMRALPPLIPLLWLSHSAHGPETLPDRNSLAGALEGFHLSPFTLGAVRGSDAYAAPVLPPTSMVLIRDQLQTVVPAAAGAPPDLLPAPVDMLFLGLRESALLPELPFGDRPLWGRPITTASVELLEVELKIAPGTNREARAPNRGQPGTALSNQGGCLIERVAWRSMAEHKLTAGR